MIRGFLICGTIGWIMEILWTGFWSFVNGDFRMTATTSILMFPIYGAAVFFKPLYNVICDLPILIRGGIYVVCIFAVEYFFGIVMTRMGICPWDYSSSKFNINGVIRLDYAPAWFAAGLIFEEIITVRQ